MVNRFKPDHRKKWILRNVLKTVPTLCPRFEITGAFQIEDWLFNPKLRWFSYSPISSPANLFSISSQVIFCLRLICSTILIISLIVKLKYIQRSSFPSKRNHLIVAEVGPIAVHLRQLNYYSRPDYFMVYSCFMKIIRRLKVKFNDIYDWEGEISISEQVSLINSVERIVNFTEHFSYFLANFSSQLSAEINIGKKNSKRNILCLMQGFVWCERSACERGTVCIDRIDSASIEHIIEICSNVRQWQTFIR